MSDQSREILKMYTFVFYELTALMPVYQALKPWVIR
jgi:hypothetical protein